MCIFYFTATPDILNTVPDEHFVHPISSKGIIPQMKVKIPQKLVKKFPTSGVFLIRNNLVF